jgi:hypothetical protein
MVHGNTSYIKLLKLIHLKLICIIILNIQLMVLFNYILLYHNEWFMERIQKLHGLTDA